MRNAFAPGLGLALALQLSPLAALAYEVSDELSINGVLAMAAQCQELSNALDYDNTCEISAPFQPEFSFRPTTETKCSSSWASRRAPVLLAARPL